MKGVARWALFAVVVVAPAALTAEPQEANLAAELAWARARWPDTLRGVHVQAPLAKLLAWVPPGQPTTAFVFAPNHDCRPIRLSRATGADSLADPRLRGDILGPVRWDDDRQTRDVSITWIGRLFEEEDGGATEVQGSDGRWQQRSSQGYGDSTLFGALSSVDDRVARFDGDPLNLVGYCAGPVEWLPCAAGGGEHPCERCERVGTMLVAPASLWGHGMDRRGYTVGCHDACPAVPQSPDLERLNALAGRLWIWRPRHTPLSGVASIYRAREECLRDHPAASARARG